jgi:hypothetical protein
MADTVECCLDGLYGLFLTLPRECVRDLTGPGDVGGAARYWAAQPEIAAQLDEIGHDRMVRALRECGAWSDEELADAESTRIRSLWVASGCTEDDYGNEEG